MKGNTLRKKEENGKKRKEDDKETTRKRENETLGETTHVVVSALLPFPFPFPFYKCIVHTYIR